MATQAVRRATLFSALAASSLLAGCAGFGRTFSYGWETADARVPFGGRAFSIYVHPHDETLLVQPSLSESFSKDALSATTARLVLEELLRDTSCTFAQPKLIAAGSYEAQYSCAVGFDLRSAILAQRAKLTQGGRLHGDR